MRTTKNRNGKTFLFAQLILFALVVGGAAVWATNINTRTTIPTLREHPRVVEPVYDYPMVVSDEQLETVLKKIKPIFSQSPPKTNFVDHALRLWGAEVQFNDNAIDGPVMRQLLTDHRTFDATWGEKELPLLIERTSGVAVRTQEGRSTVSHVDHLLGTLAEVGTPLNFPVVTNQSNTTMRDLIRYGVNSFSLNQREYEWTTVMLAFYSADAKPWFTQEGQEINFDRLATRIMRQQQPQGVCYGQHRLYTLTMMLRIDEQMEQENPGTIGLISDTARAQVMEHLGLMTKALYKNQAVEGYWDGNWPDVSVPVSDPGTDALSRRILATGHSLEWWAMAPQELHPPRETIIRAGQWLAKEIGAMDETKIQKNYTFLTHAARALALWRGKFPADHYAGYSESMIIDIDALKFEFDEESNSHPTLSGPKDSSQQ
ncbi:MAG: hypothetical protein AB8B55_17215 [Mariniblastus sp.]